MPRVVKLSDDLVAAASEAAELSHRSTTAQIEHWATLGRSMESHLTVRESGVLTQAVREPPAPAYTPKDELEQIRHRLFEALAQSATAEGSASVRRQLDALSWPQYGSNDAYPGQLVEHHQDGRLVPGRMDNGRFVATTTATQRSTPSPTAPERPTGARSDRPSKARTSRR